MSGNFDNPLVIFCSSRTGSSMVTGVFENVGFWVGECERKASYPNYENTKIRNWINMHYPLDPGNHRQNVTRSDLRSFCQIVVPDGQPWVVKALSENHTLWTHYFPRLTAAYLFRDQKQAVEAHVRRRGEQVREIATHVVSQRYTYMRKELMRNAGGFRIDAERVIDRDFSQITPIVRRYGLDFDHRLAGKDINPPMFHR